MRSRLFVPLAALALVTSGCAALASSDTAGLQVVTSFYPLEFIAQRIAGGHASITDLTKLGQEPHDLELTIRETADISLADLVVYERGLAPAVDDAVDQNAGGDVVDGADVVALQPFASDTGEHGDDPHFWQDPLLLAGVADAVATALEKVDPDHAEEYAANARTLRSELETLDADYRTGLAHCARDTIVVSHDAFGYLATYGLHVASIAGLSPDAEPTPADLQRLHQLIADDGITTVFGERLAPPRLAETLAADAGVQTAELDPLEGLTPATEDQDYLSIMRQNLQALRTADSCR